MPTAKKIRRITFLYWFLLFYIVAALVWWFISLENQNHEMTLLRQESVEQQRDHLPPATYEKSMKAIRQLRNRNNAKYLGEGIIFLTVTIIGAVFVARSMRRQFRFQQQQQHFMMAVTHEFKTPLSVARLNLETLQKHQLEESKRKKLIGMTLQETARLNFLTNNILISSQFEGGGYFFPKEELNLSDLFRDCIQDFKNRFPDRKIETRIEPDTEVSGDPLLLQLLINNLIENAVKYSPRSGTVYCELTRDGKKSVIRIIDEGAGIPDDEKKKVFDKFYRIGNESTRKAPGTGLGLYLCRKIVQDHNADISVTNNRPSGSIFAVTFHPSK